MDDQIIKDITAEIDNAFTPEGAVEIGMLTIKTANGGPALPFAFH